MKPPKKNHEFVFFSALVIISISTLLLLTGCPPGNITLAMNGTVLEQFDLGGPTGATGDVIRYSAGGFTATSSSDGTGHFGSTNATWNQTSGATLGAFNSAHNSVDEIIYNKLAGPDANVDVQGLQFLLTKPGSGTGAIIPVVISAQHADRSAYDKATVVIKEGVTMVGATGTTDPSGVCNYGTQLAANTNYTVTVAAQGGTPSTEFAFSTTPMAGTTGTLCKLRLFARF